MMTAGNNGGQLTVPPGFRFHPTDEELLYYYLRKKVSYEAIDLDVIREVDLNKLEPWDLKDKCRIGTGQQNEWYFFSHKDKKYPTGTRTNRATTAGFWKATGRDKPIHMSNNNKRIGMRKTLVFYTGRAPHGQKTDWIMHEYRLNDDADDQVLVQEDGWVVCRVFKKKTHNVRSGYQSEFTHQEEEEEMVHMKSSAHHHHHHQHHVLDQPKQNHHHQQAPPYDFTTLDSSMHLPLLFSPESAVVSPLPFISPLSLNTMDTATLCPQNLLSLTSNGGGGLIQHERLNNNSDWSFLDKLLASHQSLQDYHQLSQSKCHHHPSSQQVVDQVGTSAHHKFPFHYLGCETDILKYSK